MDYNTVYLKRMANLPLNEEEQRILAEGPLDAIKRGVQQGMNKTKAALGRAASAASKKLGDMGTEMTQGITAKKLQALWKKAGSPTDVQSISNILAQAGLDVNDISQVATQAGTNLPEPSGITQGAQQAQRSRQGAQQAQRSRQGGTPGDGVVQGAEIAQVDKAQDGENKVEPGEQQTWLKLVANLPDSIHPNSIVKLARQWGASDRDEKVILVLSSEKAKSGNAMYSKEEAVELFSRLLDPPSQQSTPEFTPDEPVKYTNNKGQTSFAKVVKNLDNGMVQLSANGATFAIDPERVTNELTPHEKNLYRMRQ